MSYAQYQSYLPSQENTPQNHREADIARERYQYAPTESRSMHPPPHPSHYQHQQRQQRPQHSYSNHHPQQQQQQRYIHNPADSRQISSTSTTIASSSSVAGGGVSGSENWETYDDASDDGDNVSYHRQHENPYANQMGPPAMTKKRGMMGSVDTPGWGGPKKLKGGYIGGGGSGGEQQQPRVMMVQDEGGRGGRMVSASESGSQWTDEDAF